MKNNGIWILLLLLAVPTVQAAETATRPSAAMGEPGHDHAAMMRDAGKAAAWTLYPTLKARVSGETRETLKTAIVPQNIVVANIDAWSNNLKDEQGFRQLPMDMGGAMLDKPANGGFHWLAAREVQGDTVRVASIVQVFGGNGGKDPTVMFMRQKHELEIIPQPYPREHARYRANEDWKFLVRFNGQPLAGQKVQLETSNGSMAEFVSDSDGVVKVHVPDDFKAEEEQPAAGGHNHGVRRASELVLATEYAEGGKAYLTAFNSSYGPNAFDKRSLTMGLGFTLLGMLGAVPLLRKRKNEQKAEEADNA